MAAGRITKKQKSSLQELEKLARKLGLKVSYGKLRFAGLKLKGGQCIYRGEKWLVMDRNQPFDEQVDLYREAFKEFDLTSEEISPDLNRILKLGVL